MRHVTIDQDCPESWQYSYQYDLIEIYGQQTHLGHTSGYNNRLHHTLDLIQQVAKPGAKILDVAAAQGNFSLLLAELGYEVTWNDLREDLIDYVKLKHELGTIHFAPGDVFTLGLESEFDVVLITEIIEHVAHPDDFLRRIATLTKPGGYIVMTTPNGEYFRNKLPKFSDCPDPSVFESIQFKPDADGHIFLLHLNEVYELAQKTGLVVQDLRVFTNPLTIGYLKLGILLKFLPASWVKSLEHLTSTLPLVISKKINTGIGTVFFRPGYRL
jgi:2-polyprenyl-6-hydroxyphenyl methylase/3-demethylubiquinone-9 3-methyltransferase